MKYTESKKPMVCMQKNSTCYKGTRPFTPRGVLWHSTGANNPSISRYVQPHETDDNHAEMLALLGKNRYGNDWNHIERQAGMNCWIGKLADGTVATVQTMPWDYKPWGCGAGPKGSLNNTHIQFEICEDDLQSQEYFDQVYREACEVTAYLCKLYGLDPHGTFEYKGVTVPVITDHRGSYKLGLGGNHGDVNSWFKLYGKTLEDVRKDVAALMASAESPMPTLQKGDKRKEVKPLQALLLGYGYTQVGEVDGSFGGKTRQALTAYQTDRGLPPDGVCGAETWNSLLER